jgi:homoserine kinase
VALDRYLEIEAEPAAAFSIECAGRDSERCSKIEDNLILETYKELLKANQRPVVPLALRMRNEIPLGMGLGSSAAGRLAAIALAMHFGDFGWTPNRILEEACALEGHPDNAAACWLGGFVMAACEGQTVHVARVEPPKEWRAILVLPDEPLATSKARAALPESYSRGDVVANIQAAGLLGLAFAQGRGDLLRMAMADRIHQPYRAPICPLLDRLLPLAGQDGILGVALSGAGPAVLAVIENESALAAAAARIQSNLKGLLGSELMVSRFELQGACLA